VSRRHYDDPTPAEMLGAAVLLVATLFLAWLSSVLSTPL